MDYAMFMPQEKLKGVMAYRPYETGALHVILKQPKTAAEKADVLYPKLTPNPAYIQGQIDSQTVAVVAFAQREQKGVVLSKTLARRLAKKIGGDITVRYPTKFLGEPFSFKATVSAIDATQNAKISPDVIWMNRDDFFKNYNYALPKNALPLSVWIDASADSAVGKKVAREWQLLSRTRTTDEFSKKMKNIMKDSQVQSLYDVSTMYEVASQVVQMEVVLNLIALIAASILLFIIMVGVLNSLRMTIKERTQEIGTMRALGMKSSQVRALIVCETLILSLVSWLAGIILAFFVMKGLRMFQFGADNALNMVMVDRRIYFVLTGWQFVKNFVLLMLFTLGTAYFPAKQAAGLKPAQAFRHISD
jgi:ABC-type antimicrobial peptide transport system permease subunit